MLRSLFIYLSKAAWARRIVTRWPLAWRVASRFVAGETLQDAIRVIKSLNAKGIDATLDMLGEHTTTPDEAVRATHGILEILDAIEVAQVRSNVSIKLSQIGLELDEELCKENLRRILTYARQRNNFVRIDMEDTPWTEKTLRLYRAMCNEGLTNTGVVIQSYLYRSAEDVLQVAGSGGRIRLCKGAYKEPPELAYPKKQDVDQNYDRLTALLIDLAQQNGSPEISADRRVPPIPAIATHDEARVVYARQYAQQTGFPKRALEFQMLNGIRRDLQERLAAEGYPVRVYVPFGTEWYPYFTRRLAERPANVWFFVSNFFKR
jgi:proline dehydrogenase